MSGLILELKVMVDGRECLHVWAIGNPEQIENMCVASSLFVERFAAGRVETDATVVPSDPNNPTLLLDRDDLLDKR